MVKIPWQLWIWREVKNTTQCFGGDLFPRFGCLRISSLMLSERDQPIPAAPSCLGIWMQVLVPYSHPLTAALSLSVLSLSLHPAHVLPLLQSHLFLFHLPLLNLNSLAQCTLNYLPASAALWLGLWVTEICTSPLRPSTHYMLERRCLENRKDISLWIIRSWSQKKWIFPSLLFLSFWEFQFFVIFIWHCLGITLFKLLTIFIFNYVTFYLTFVIHLRNMSCVKASSAVFIFPKTWIENTTN